MNKTCIFKVSAGDDIYRVEERRMGSGQLVYVVVNHRKMVEYPSIFEYLSDAVKRSVDCAYESLRVIMEKGERL